MTGVLVSVSMLLSLIKTWVKASAEEKPQSVGVFLKNSFDGRYFPIKKLAAYIFAGADRRTEADFDDDDIYEDDNLFEDDGNSLNND